MTPINLEDPELVPIKAGVDGPINMLARGKISFRFFGPRDVGETFQAKLNARLAHLEDELMGELLREPAISAIHMED